MSTDLVKARIMSVMKNLPPLPAVTRQLLAILRDDDASANDVTKVLSSDSALAAKVLKLVNSSFYGVPSEVTTISRAVVILGFTGIRNLALSFGSVEALSAMGSKMDMTAFWSHAMATAAAAQSLAPFVSRRTDPEEAFVAGLMHDIGTFVLATAVPETYEQILQAPASERMALEKAQTGFTHAKIGQGLLKFWDLPDPFTNAAGNHHNMGVATGGDEPLTNLVALADILACIHNGVFETSASENDLQRLLAAAGLKSENVFSTLAAMEDKIKDMAVFMKIAGGGSSDRLDLSELRAMTCVVVTTDDQRRDLVEGLLKHQGHQLFPMESYFNQAGASSEVELVLVDPQSLSRDQVDRLAVFMEAQTLIVGVLSNPETDIPESMSAWPTVNSLFGPPQLSEICRLQPA